eukprot:CAMPEP_0195511222 /NCGR_PEP_ID=MMETSP0794_2-20130614/3620_1 /TAXON_ID=515487 /ORGANISM="Stephanopyxis turris, Strain CCMP 815" /LENGTH=676 /DNA_ID=CAMNT_0040638779 /DNA_START=95 /DNA_END=2122 /DNA_ORIENTATION=-
MNNAASFMLALLALTSIQSGDIRVNASKQAPSMHQTRNLNNQYQTLGVVNVGDESSLGGVSSRRILDIESTEEEPILLHYILSKNQDRNIISAFTSKSRTIDNNMESKSEEVNDDDMETVLIGQFPVESSSDTIVNDVSCECIGSVCDYIVVKLFLRVKDNNNTAKERMMQVIPHLLDGVQRRIGAFQHDEEDTEKCCARLLFLAIMNEEDDEEENVSRLHESQSNEDEKSEYSDITTTATTFPDEVWITQQLHTAMQERGMNHKPIQFQFQVKTISSSSPLFSDRLSSEVEGFLSQSTQNVFSEFALTINGEETVAISCDDSLRSFCVLSDNICNTLLSSSSVASNNEDASAIKTPFISFERLSRKGIRDSLVRSNLLAFNENVARDTDQNNEVESSNGLISSSRTESIPTKVEIQSKEDNKSKTLNSKQNRSNENDITITNRIKGDVQSLLRETETKLQHLEEKQNEASLNGRMPILEFGHDADSILKMLTKKFDSMAAATSRNQPNSAMVSNMIKEKRKEVLTHLAGDAGLKRLFHQQVAALREHYGGRYENAVNEISEKADIMNDAKKREQYIAEAASRATEGFRAAAKHAIPQLCKQGQELRDVDGGYEYVTSLNGLIEDMIETTSLCEGMEDDWNTAASLEYSDDDDLDEEMEDGQSNPAKQRRNKPMKW